MQVFSPQVHTVNLHLLTSNLICKSCRRLLLLDSKSTNDSGDQVSCQILFASNVDGGLVRVTRPSVTAQCFSSLGLQSSPNAAMFLGYSFFLPTINTSAIKPRNLSKWPVPHLVFDTPHTKDQVLWVECTWELKPVRVFRMFTY